MPRQGHLSMPKRKYAKISTKKRQNLIESVLNKGCSLTKTAKKLNLKLSTAKLILRKFKQTGEFHIKRVRRSTVRTPAAEDHEELVNSRENNTPQKEMRQFQFVPDLPMVNYDFINCFWPYSYCSYYPSLIGNYSQLI